MPRRYDRVDTPLWPLSFFLDHPLQVYPAHPPLGPRDTLTFGRFFSQPLFAWCDEGKHRRREVCAGGAHGRNKHGTRIFVLVIDVGTWLRDRVEHLAFRCPVLAEVSCPLLALWSEGPYHGHKIAGHTSSPTPSGPNILTFSRASSSPLTVVCRGSLWPCP